MRGADGVADRLVHRLGETAELADVEIHPAHLVLVALPGGQDDFGLDDAGVADHAASRLDDGLRDLVAEMLAQRAEDRPAVLHHRRHVLEVLGREAAAHVDHGQVDAALRAVAEHRRGHRQRAVPRLHLALLRADMERDAAWLQAEAPGEFEHLDRHFRIAAELARERPFGAGTVIDDAAEHLCAGGGARHLLDLGAAVDGEQPNAEREGARDIPLLLDRIAIGDALGGGTRGQRHLDFGDRGAVEARAHRGQQRQHFRRRVGLHRVEHAAVWQRRGEGLIVVAHDFEVDDEARLDVLALAAAVAQEFLNTFGHSTPPNGPATGTRSKMISDKSAPATSRDGGATKPKYSNRIVLPWIGWE